MNKDKFEEFKSFLFYFESEKLKDFLKKNPEYASEALKIFKDREFGLLGYSQASDLPKTFKILREYLPKGEFKKLVKISKRNPSFKFLSAEVINELAKIEEFEISINLILGDLLARVWERGIKAGFDSPAATPSELKNIEEYLKSSELTKVTRTRAEAVLKKYKKALKVVKEPLKKTKKNIL